MTVSRAKKEAFSKYEILNSDILTSTRRSSLVACSEYFIFP